MVTLEVRRKNRLDILEDTILWKRDASSTNTKVNLHYYKNQKPLAIVESHFCRLIMFGQTTKLSGSGGFVSQVVGQSG